MVALDRCAAGPRSIEEPLASSRVDMRDVCLGVLAMPQTPAVLTNPAVIGEDVLTSVRLLELHGGKRPRFDAEEVSAVHSFVRRGGSLLTVIDEELRTPLLTDGINLLIVPFGLRYTADTEYLHNCGALAKAGRINAADRAVPYSGGRAVSGGVPFAWRLDAAGSCAEAFAAYAEVPGGGRIVALAEGMAYGLMGTAHGERLTGVPRDPSRTTYWGKDAGLFMDEVRSWLLGSPAHGNVSGGENRMTEAELDLVLRQQADYYRARAGEYDQWWLRQGRYDRGPMVNARWFAEADEVAQTLAALKPAGRVLELACGTGIWTQKLLKIATGVTAVDSSPEALSINAARNASEKLRLIQADLFQWKPEERYDLVFFGFWLSHVPEAKFAEFWELVVSCLAPGGRVFFVDSDYERTSMAIDDRPPSRDDGVARRRLNDGREFQIIKVFHDPAELTDRLAELGWRFDVKATGQYFIYGAGRRR